MEEEEYTTEEKILAKPTTSQRTQEPGIGRHSFETEFKVFILSQNNSLHFLEQTSNIES